MKKYLAFSLLSFFNPSFVFGDDLNKSFTEEGETPSNLSVSPISPSIKEENLSIEEIHKHITKALSDSPTPNLEAALNYALKGVEKNDTRSMFFVAFNHEKQGFYEEAATFYKKGINDNTSLSFLIGVSRLARLFKEGKIVLSDEDVLMYRRIATDSPLTLIHQIYGDYAYMLAPETSWAISYLEAYQMSLQEEKSGLPKEADLVIDKVFSFLLERRLPEEVVKKIILVKNLLDLARILYSLPLASEGEKEIHQN